MKQTITLAAMAATLAGGAHAQSGVTVFGVIDTGIEVVDNAPDANGNAASLAHLKSGNLWGSRWGLRGREDLGGGLGAIYHLEGGFASDTGAAGQGGRLFGRSAYAGLGGQSNRVTVGRQNNSLYDVMYFHDPLGMATYSTLTHDPVLAGRADNAIKYTGQFKEVMVTGLYSFGHDSTVKDGGEIAGAPKVGRELSGGLRYTPGALNFGLAFDQRHGTSHASQNETEQRIAAGISYSMGAVKTYLGYRWLKSDAADSSGGSSFYWGGLSYQATPAFSLTGMTAYTDTRGSDADPLTFVLLGSYDLSKRSSLYLLTSYARNAGESNMGVNGISNQIVAGNNQTGVIAGILHTF
ncbi:porin [Collimonas antrihumi]|uniref:porin n=1 Tax=Collimonas antrihumi TaxID=1940615 RepID=UPI001B8B1E3F|nr:porin [Collimonas antrihumi]